MYLVDSFKKNETAKKEPDKPALGNSGKQT